MGTPGARLQGPFVRGSALALASWLPVPVATAPASIKPRSSNARRCSRPLPATGSAGEDAKSCVRFLRMLMGLSPARWIICQEPDANLAAQAAAARPFRSPAWLRRHTKAHRPSDTHSLLSLAEVTRRFGRIIAERIEVVGFVQKAFNRRLRRHRKVVREQHCLTELMVP